MYGVVTKDVILLAKNFCGENYFRIIEGKFFLTNFEKSNLPNLQVKNCQISTPNQVESNFTMFFLITCKTLILLTSKFH